MEEIKIDKSSKNDEQEKLKDVKHLIQSTRRERNKQLLDAVYGEKDIYNIEDLMRLVGELNSAYNHICTMISAKNSNIYCLLKHLSTAITLANEVDGYCENEYNCLAILTDNKIQPCIACKENK